ncbi:MAG: hypothetical protein HY521_11520 [Proteobacteria bacterium]|nr:hypothetical protein [Pseudomonadota bacterium]
MLASNITIATSLAPKGLEKQRVAVESWRGLGFEVVSLNLPAEIEALRDAFPGIGFASVRRTAEEHFGRPLVYFDDVLRELRKTAGRVVGIVNSDIILRADGGLHDFIRERAEGGFLFGSRVDVDSPDGVAGAVYDRGFDYFFLDKAVTQVYPGSSFCLGMPWWDYWAPLIPALKGAPMRHLASRIAFHVAHDSDWRGGAGGWFTYAGQLADFLHRSAHEKAQARRTAGPVGEAEAALLLAVDLANYCYKRTVADFVALRRAAEGSASDQRRQKALVAEQRLALYFNNLSEFICEFVKRAAERLTYGPLAR